VAADGIGDCSARCLRQGRAWLSGIRYLTFDCYGTLIDWKTGIERSLRRAFGAIPLQGKDLLDAYVLAEKEEEGSYKRYREVLRNTAVRLSKSIHFAVSSSGAEAFADSVPSWPAFPDTRKALQELGRIGYARYILSNVDTDLLEGTIRKSGLEVDGFVTAEEVGSYKPNRGHWLRFMQKTGAKKEEVLHVAQSIYHDIVPAQEMGITSAWVNRYAEPLPSSAHPEYIVDSLESLAKLLA
jgi:2-haloalkanoic acid dehalogenase type II